jgi:TetR/AcrR family transcriptional regulator, transcriptional repressor for nem operon
MIIVINWYSTAMPTQPTRSEATHERIVEVAARTLRRNGYAGVGVADVMKQAGLTHGGFYAHFASREALLEEAVERAGEASAQALDRRIENARARGQSPLRALVDGYLSEAHLRAVESGCVVAALSSEMPRQSPGLLASSAQRVRKLVATVQRALPEGGTHEQAMAISATMVGALQLARTLGRGAQGKAVLAAARSAILSQHE